MTRQSGGRINNPYGGREHGKEKIIKGYVLDADTIRKALGIKERDMRKREIYSPEKPTKPPMGPDPEPPMGEYGTNPGVPNPAIKQMKDLLRVAKAAKELWSMSYYEREQYHAALNEFANALKEVEYLL